jgi:hypothetical protein
MVSLSQPSAQVDGGAMSSSSSSADDLPSLYYALSTLRIVLPAVLLGLLATRWLSKAFLAWSVIFPLLPFERCADFSLAGWAAFKLVDGPTKKTSTDRLSVRRLPLGRRRRRRRTRREPLEAALRRQRTRRKRRTTT